MMSNLAFFCYKLIVCNERLRETFWFHGWPTNFLNHVPRLFYIFTAINKSFCKIFSFSSANNDFRKLRYNLNVSNLALFGLFLYSFQRFCFLFIDFRNPDVNQGATGVDLFDRGFF